MEEETTLTESSLRFFRQGRPYSFVDEAIGREWTINPFGFILISKGGNANVEDDGIRIDWEHHGYSWFKLTDVNDSDTFGGVPRLLESLRRVWFDIDLGHKAGSALARGLEMLRHDHDSGARQLASNALDIFIDVVDLLDASSTSAWWRNVRTTAWHLWKNGRESMGAPILSVVVSCLSLVEKSIPSCDVMSREIADSIIKDLRKLAEQRRISSSAIAEAFRTFLAGYFPKAKRLTILTLSSSSTIASTLLDSLESGDVSLEIRVLESRPLFEGVKMAARLTQTDAVQQGHSSVTVYTDASAAVAAQHAQIVLLGADIIDKHGNVSNKTGSLPTVLAARYISPEAKVIVLSEREKVLPFEPPGHEENDPGEVSNSWQDIAPGLCESPDSPITVRNVYFEWVGGDLVDRYVTEVGVMSKKDIGLWAGTEQSRIERFFMDL